MISHTLSHRLSSENFLSSLPEVLRQDSKMEALASSIAGVLDKRMGEIQRLSIYARMDDLPEDLLDILAYDFKIDWYDYNYPVETKRNLLKSCWSVHRRLGTKASVDAALSSVYPGSSTEEWFQYGGQPYHFRVICDITDDSIPANWTDLVNVVRTYKRLSAKPDGISYQTRVSCVIGTHTDYFIYSLPQAGTKPHRNTISGVVDTNIMTQTAIDRVQYANSPTGVAKAGTMPQRAAQGGIVSTAIEVDVGTVGNTYTVPLSGTLPDRATFGKTSNGNVSNQVDGTAYRYSVKRCGSHKL